MKEVELEEYFGLMSLVQFREAVALAVPGKKAPHMRMLFSGQPHFIAHQGQVRAAMSEQIVPELARPDGDVSYTLTLNARLMPAASGRIFVCYEAGGHIAKLCVRPEDILAVTSIEENPEGARIVAPS